MPSLKISIVTISYNQGRFLDQCINSVLGQDCPEVEYIVVDPGSMDGSREIIQKYSGRIKRTIFQPDSGPAHGLNTGFKAASNEILGFINADDRLLPGAITSVLEYFEKNPGIDVLRGHGYQIDEGGNRVKKIFSTRWSALAYAYGAVGIVQPATFFRKTAFESAGGFNVDNRTCWDGELLAAMAMAGARFGRTNAALGEFRLYGGSISGSGLRGRLWEKDRRRIEKMILGREKNAMDKYIGKGIRMWQIIRDPRITIYKAAKRAIGNPCA